MIKSYKKLLIAFCFIFYIYYLFFGNFSLAKTKKNQGVAFNFIDIELSALTKLVSDITGKNFIFDNRLKGKVSIIAPSKLPIDAIYNLFISVLEYKGFTVVPSGANVYKIIPIREAKQKGLQVVTKISQVNDNYIVRLFTLKYISSVEAVRFLRPLVSHDGYISAFGPGNMLLVIDSGNNIEKINSILEKIDQPYFSDNYEIIFLTYAIADSVAKIIKEGILQRLTTKGQPPRAKIVVDQRLNALVVFGDREIREVIKKLVKTLDVPTQEARRMINVYFLENADAVELAKVLQEMLKGIRSKQTSTKGPPRVKTLTSFEMGKITIVADKPTNSLIIVASPNDYKNLVKIIKKLDKKRRQVFVEAMIVEASIEKLKEIGARWRAIIEKNKEPITITGFGAIDPQTLQNIIYGLTGLTVGGMMNFRDIFITTLDPSTGEITKETLSVPTFAAIFSLSLFKDAVNILSTPQLLTSDNEEAEIVVGENVPLITREEVNPARPGSLFHIIERYDVGIKLKITPRITEGEYVKLDIYQEISSVKAEPTEIVTTIGPTLIKRSTKTSVIVKNGETVVIGGLMQEKKEKKTIKIPFLGDIPLLGHLFKYQSISKKKTNLLIFITPHIIKDKKDLAKITEQKKKEFIKLKIPYVEGELLIKFKEGIPYEKAISIISEKGATLIKFIKNLKLYHIKLKKGQSVKNAIKEFSSLPEIEYVEPNYLIDIKHKIK